MKSKFDKKIISSLIVSIVSVQMMQAIAQGVSTQNSGSTTTTVSSLSTSSPTIPNLPDLHVEDPSNAPPDCNKEIMQNLNSQYLEKRGLARIRQYNNEMSGLVLTTPKANQMDCFQQAMQNIKNLMSAINSIIAIFSGRIDMDAIMQQVVNMVLKAACQEINQVTGSISGSLNTVTNGINGTVSGINNTNIGSGPVNLNVGNILTSGNPGNKSNTGTTDIIGGSLNSINSTLGVVNNTTNNASNIGTSIVNKISSINPFGSSNN
jgi:hypothetical protein